MLYLEWPNHLSNRFRPFCLLSCPIPALSPEQALPPVQLTTYFLLFPQEAENDQDRCKQLPTTCAVWSCCQPVTLCFSHLQNEGSRPGHTHTHTHPASIKPKYYRKIKFLRTIPSHFPFVFFLSFLSLVSCKQFPKVSFLSKFHAYTPSYTKTLYHSLSTPPAAVKLTSSRSALYKRTGCNDEHVLYLSVLPKIQ